jgi:hypothetical protein
MYEVYSTFASHRSWRPKMSLDDFALKTAFGEDLLYGYVFISSLGDQFGVQTHAIDTMINLAELVLSREFWTEGVSVESLGLKDMTAEEIINYVMNG